MYKIAIVGGKDSGKTTLIEILLENMSKKGYRCMSKKHTSHHHAFDTVGKDSQRHRKAGASLTLATNPGEFAIFSEQNVELQNKLEKCIESEFDFCLIEGDKFSDVDKILLTRNISTIDSDKIQTIIATYGDTTTSLSDNHFDTRSIDKLISFIISQTTKKSNIEELS